MKRYILEHKQLVVMSTHQLSELTMLRRFKPYLKHRETL